MDDNIRRDDLKKRSPTDAFNSLENPNLRRALKKAAVQGASNLPQEMEKWKGWIMVPIRGGAAQVAYEGKRAWRL